VQILGKSFKCSVLVAKLDDATHLEAESKWTFSTSPADKTEFRRRQEIVMEKGIGII
jgi:hypothetical protein